MTELANSLHRRAKEIGREWKLERKLSKISDELIQCSVACRRAVNNAFDETIAAHWKLHDFDRYYKRRFFTEHKPPLLGLTPVRKRQVEAIKQLVLQNPLITHTQGGDTISAFDFLTERHRYALSLFLTHAIIQSYEHSEHALFDRLEEVTGLPVADPENVKNREKLAKLLDVSSKILLNITWLAEANQLHFKNLGLFLAHAGLTVSQARPFARWMFCCWKEYGLPSPEDIDCGEALQGRMLSVARSSSRVASRWLVRSVSRPPGAYVCKGALHFINDSEQPLLSPDLREALHDEFHFRQKKFWQAQVEPPFIRLSASEMELELIVPPQREFSSSTDHWEINGENYPLEQFNPLVFSASGVESFTVCLIRTRQQCCLYEKHFPLNILEGRSYWLLVDGENRRVIFDNPDIEEKIDLHPGIYHLLFRYGVKIDPQPVRIQSFSTGKTLATLQLDDDPETDEIPPSYFLKAPDGSTAQLHVQRLPEARVTGGLVLHSQTVDIYSEAAQLELNIQKPDPSTRIVLSVLAAGDDKPVSVETTWEKLDLVMGATHSWRLLPLENLKPGINEVWLRIFKGEGLLEEILFDEHFYFWSGLAAAPPSAVLSENDQIKCSSMPVNWRQEQSLGFTPQADSLSFHVDSQSLDKMARLVFQCGGRTIVAAFERKGIFLELLVRCPGRDLERQSLKKGSSVSLEDRLFHFLRVYYRGKNWLRLFCDDEAVTPPSRKGWVEVPLTQLRQMQAQGKILTLQVEREPAVPILSFDPISP